MATVTGSVDEGYTITLNVPVGELSVPPPCPMDTGAGGRQLPDQALAGVGERPFGVYVHVPFCTVRCGYCDFNTYTAAELGTASGAPGRLAGDVRRRRGRGGTPGPPAALGDRDVPVSTVFFGGGTPTLLSPADLGSVVAAIDAEFGLVDGAEVTTEANPDSVTPPTWRSSASWASTGSRSACSPPSTTCCSVLDRTHDPARVPDVVAWARAAGFEQVSLDLIYGTPGESVADWERSLDAALACAPDHVSAYSLVVEEGTALARRVRRGELPTPDQDDLADKYLVADERLSAAGLELVRDLQLVPRRGEPVPAQPPLLDRRRLVGRRPGRSLPRRRRAVVERQAPGGVRRPAGRRTQPGAGPRGARRRDPAGGTGAARAAAARGAAAVGARRRRAGARWTTWSAAGLLEPAASGWCSPARRLLGDAVVRDLLGWGPRTGPRMAVMSPRRPTLPP